VLCAAAAGASSRAQDEAAPLDGAGWSARPERPSSSLRLLAPDDILILDTTKGRIVIEILPELAPDVAAEIRSLARQGAFDRAPFDRVVDGFRAEIALPSASAARLTSDVAPSFEFAPVLVAVADSDRGRAGSRSSYQTAAADDGGLAFGIYKGAPIATRVEAAAPAPGEPAPDEPVWATHCPGVASYEPPQVSGEPGRIFIMRGDAPAIDGHARPWGMVVSGLEVVYDLAVGDAQTPGFEPDRMLAVRVAADGTWTSFEAREDVAVLTLLDETGPGFAGFVASLREELGRPPRLCEIRLPLGPPTSGLLARATGAPP
jgi:peptidylprolyl isomerase